MLRWWRKAPKKIELIPREIRVKTKTGSKRSSEEPVIDPRVLEAAKMTIFEPQPEKTFACRVCGSEGATEQSERLCWVCRRLKISAWKDTEQQMMFTE